MRKSFAGFTRITQTLRCETIFNYVLYCTRALGVVDGQYRNSRKLTLNRRAFRVVRVKRFVWPPQTTVQNQMAFKLFGHARSAHNRNKGRVGRYARELAEREFLETSSSIVLVYTRYERPERRSNCRRFPQIPHAGSSGLATRFAYIFNVMMR